MISQYFFKADLNFKNFSRRPLNSSIFQACSNPDKISTRTFELHENLNDNIGADTDAV